MLDQKLKICQARRSAHFEQTKMLFKGPYIHMSLSRARLTTHVKPVNLLSLARRPYYTSVVKTSVPREGCRKHARNIGLEILYDSVYNSFPRNVSFSLKFYIGPTGTVVLKQVHFFACLQQFLLNYDLTFDLICIKHVFQVNKKPYKTFCKII